MNSTRSTNRTLANPFGPNRIEYENKPVLWFSKKSSSISREPISVYVAGTRGSGKTSILRSMSTFHILEDPYLSKQVGTLDWYGVFFQLNETFSPLIDNAALSLIAEPLRFDPEALRHRKFLIFSNYLELKIVERLMETMSMLRGEGHLLFSASNERTVALRIHDEVLHFLPSTKDNTFYGFENLRRQVSIYLDRCINSYFYAGSNSDEKFFATDPGSIITKIVDLVSPMVEGPAFSKDAQVRFKILIDDCEALTPEQQMFLNSIVRKTRGKVRWVLAYIGGLYDTSRTVIPGQSLSEADRLVENLDAASDADFSKLCQNVASLRLFHFIPEELRDTFDRDDPLQTFSLRNRLGNYSVNEIIERVIETGYSEGRNQLIDAAEEAREFFSVKVDRKFQEQLPKFQKARPYTEGLALRLLAEEDRKRISSGGEVRALIQTIRRKQGWAFLEACRILRLHDYPYVGFNIIIQLSDSCIRDFLDIMREIFDLTAPKSMDKTRWVEFINLNSEFPMELQRKAVNLASEKKLIGLKTLSAPHEEKSLRLVNSLGQLTTKLQMAPSQSNKFKTFERGLYRVDLKELRSMASNMGLMSSDIDDMLKRSEKDGFIREATENGRLVDNPNIPEASEVIIRLHRRFAPNYRFSYRGPYEVSTLPSWLLIKLLFDRAFIEHDWVDSVMKSLFASHDNNEHDQPSLFDSEQ
nr:hypothetical protein [uncultured Cohaesibacter sp.]